jgi:hypothetical protein
MPALQKKEKKKIVDHVVVEGFANLPELEFGTGRTPTTSRTWQAFTQHPIGIEVSSMRKERYATQRTNCVATSVSLVVVIIFVNPRSPSMMMYLEGGK